MTESEWVRMGYLNNLIEADAEDVPTFTEAYRAWFNYKRGQIRPQSLDRIEGTWNRYYRDTAFAGGKLSSLDEGAVTDFINAIFASCGSMTLKEYRKVYQIVNNVLDYAVDFGMPGARLLNWRKVKGYAYTNHIVSTRKDTAGIRDSDIAQLLDFVLSGGYYRKQSACLLLLANFYMGLRVGELAALTWHDIDFGGKRLYVSKTETKSYCRDDEGNRTHMRLEVSEPKTAGSVRTVPLCDKAVAMLRLVRQHHEGMGYGTERLLYDGADIEGIRSLERTVGRLCVLADVLSFSTHMIRKTVATKMHYAGLPSRMIADMLGHVDISTTERCYILTDKEYVSAMSHTLNDVFNY